MRNFFSLSMRAVLMLGALHLTVTPALAEDKPLAPGHAAGHSAAAPAPLAPGKAAGTNKAQAVSPAGGFLIVGLGGLVIAGAVLVVSGSSSGGNGGSERVSPQNFSMTTGTSP
ncbi:MAG TPA: hypothetical protein VGM68_08765 [Rhizomicrobium sp.]|jgi:hypothetical protein